MYISFREKRHNFRQLILKKNLPLLAVRVEFPPPPSTSSPQREKKKNKIKEKINQRCGIDVCVGEVVMHSASLYRHYMVQFVTV